jgi:hypothetical protein
VEKFYDETKCPEIIPHFVHNKQKCPQLVRVEEEEIKKPTKTKSQ